ncbi:MAG: AI-2E family transporter [Candidatus Delongbacteria bacterium]|nr:AI-2E family transporter [Candidatus Delongbacteria bacterium]
MLKEVELGPKQKSAVAAAVTVLSIFIIVLFAGSVIWGIVSLIGTFQNVFFPPVVAGVIAMLVRPFYNWIFRLAAKKHTIALILFFLSIMIPASAALWFFGSMIVDHLIQLIEDMPAIIDSVYENLRSYWPRIVDIADKYEVKEGLTSMIGEPVRTAADALAFTGESIFDSLKILFSYFAGLLTWAVLPVYLAFFLIAEPFVSEKIGDFLPFLKKKTKEDVIYLFDQFNSILVTFFRGQIIIALIQGLMFAAGFAVVGLPYGITIGMMLGFLNIVPYLGSIVGLAVAVPLAYLNPDGGLTQAFLVVGVFSVVQTIEGYLLTPKIMGNRTGLHPALIIFAMFFWGVALNGILGMILAIPLTAFAVVFWRLLKKKYIKELL